MAAKQLKSPYPKVIDGRRIVDEACVCGRPRSAHENSALQWGHGGMADGSCRQFTFTSFITDEAKAEEQRRRANAGTSPAFQAILAVLGSAECKTKVLGVARERRLVAASVELTLEQCRLLRQGDEPAKAEPVRYEGWVNYPTFLVHTFLSQHETAMAQAIAIVRDECEMDLEAGAQGLKSYVDDLMPVDRPSLPGDSLAFDLLTSALDEVDFGEIAEEWARAIAEPAVLEAAAEAAKTFEAEFKGLDPSPEWIRGAFDSAKMWGDGAHAVAAWPEASFETFEVTLRQMLAELRRMPAPARTKRVLRPQAAVAKSARKRAK